MQLNRQNQHHTNATYQKVLLQIQSEVTSPDPNPMEALVEMKNVLGIQLSQQQIAHFLTHNFSSLVKLAGRDEKEVKDGDYYKKKFYSLYQRLNDLFSGALPDAQRNSSVVNKKNKNEGFGREKRIKFDKDSAVGE